MAKAAAQPKPSKKNDVDATPPPYEGRTATSDSVGVGATYTATYVDRVIEGVPVSIRELEDFKSASVEEFWQFVAGEFLVAGAFWLGVERLVTVDNAMADLLFWICVVAFVAGCIVGFFGYRQLSRRQSRIEEIVAAAKERIANRETTQST
ncbi:hypothetical protein [Bauldia litoralis]|uniref:hypothetical protein n=1 Tax=Bauldia litoralis TaxID=665467 RepID=UPI000B8070BB|nr:hypothetical protein [Bauldia litoralis]